jgi:hypothetical protein
MFSELNRNATFAIGKSAKQYSSDANRILRRTLKI